MSESQRASEAFGTTEKEETSQRRFTSRSLEGRRRKSPSMHEGIAAWCDCCSCEAEPYWVEIAEEMGIDLGSDYEDEVVPARI
jgi:hypothetical protein